MDVCVQRTRSDACPDHQSPERTGYVRHSGQLGRPEPLAASRRRSQRARVSRSDAVFELVLDSEGRSLGGLKARVRETHAPLVPARAAGKIQRRRRGATRGKVSTPREPGARPVRYSATARRSASLSSAPCWRMTPVTSASTIDSGGRSRSAATGGARVGPGVAGGAVVVENSGTAWRLGKYEGDTERQHDQRRSTSSNIADRRSRDRRFLYRCLVRIALEPGSSIVP